MGGYMRERCPSAESIQAHEGSLPGRNSSWAPPETASAKTDARQMQKAQKRTVRPVRKKRRSRSGIIRMSHFNLEIRSAFNLT